MRRPLLQIIGPSGADILPKLGGFWKSVRVSEKGGQESDTATIVTVGPPDRVALPKKGDRYTILMGWDDEGLVNQGSFTVQKIQLSGTPRGGHEITIPLRAADFVDKLKGEGREHYDETTLGDLLKKVAAKAGVPAVVDPELAKLKIPYALRWDQSVIDFATETVERLGGTLKPMAGQLVATKRGGGTSGSGKTLEPIRLFFNEAASYDFDLDPRPAAGTVSASWYDPKSGARKHVKHKTGFDGPLKTLPTVYRTEAEAKAAAAAEGYETGNRTGSGTVRTAGLPRARAGAPATLEGWDAPVDGPWKAESVDKEITAKSGFTTDVSLTAGTDKKGSK